MWFSLLSVAVYLRVTYGELLGAILVGSICSLNLFPVRQEHVY